MTSTTQHPTTPAPTKSHGKQSDPTETSDTRTSSSLGLLRSGVLHEVQEAERFWAGSTANVFEWAHQLDDFVRHRLPRLNCAIEAKRAAVLDLMTEVRVMVRIAKPELAELLNTADARIASGITQRLGFVAASLERHAQAGKAAPGDGVLAVSGFTELLVAWAEKAGVSPMLDYDGYWLRNRDKPLTFTGEPEELVFNALVNRTVDVVDSILLPINELRNGTRALDAIDTAPEISLQALKLNALCESYRYLGHKTDSGPAFTPAFFMRMRQYLLSFPIGGVLRDGPNATFAPNQARIDIALGICMPAYSATLIERLNKMTSAHRMLISAEMAMPSVADIVARELMSDVADWTALDSGEIRSRAERRGANVVATMTALKQLTHAQIQLSNVHFGRIGTHLRKPSAKLTPAEADTMPVKSSGGVGGNDIAHTTAIVDMRKGHPVFTTLLSGF